ncbi:MAG: FHA domain-containing protein [Leptolyngbya sp. SIO4C1]|nr:FHA domain-containing protein [Leptolyngbya sp. SIO4C1]
MQIQLRWVDAIGSERTPTLQPPVAFGCSFGLMPTTLGDRPVSRMVLEDEAVEPYHALLEVVDNQLRIHDRGSRTGTKVNGLALPYQAVTDGDRIQIGPFEIAVSLPTAQAPSLPSPTCDRKIGFLFKRRCDRPTSEGCPHCRNGQIPPGQDLYAEDYDLYPGYGRYGRGYWGYHYHSNRDRYYYDPASRQVDFTEADAASFEDEYDQDYEMTLDAS